MKLSAAPAANLVTQAEYGVSTVVIHHYGSSATLTVFSSGYLYTYWFEKDGSLTQQVVLKGHITRSTVKACHVGRYG